MSKVEHITIPMTAVDEILLTLGFDDSHKLVRAAVQYRAFMDGAWVAVCRYDNAHGVHHRHEYWNKARVAELPTGLSLKDMVARAERDIRRNWPRYRARMEETA